MTIPDKETFNRLSQRGLLGNYLRTWPYTVDVIRHSVWFTIRGNDKAFKHFVPVVGAADLWAVCDGLKHKGVSKDEYYIQEIPAPDSKRVIQFEAFLGPSWPGCGAGVELVYELDTDKPLRGIRERALAGEARNCSGLVAQAVLRTYLSPDSYETLTDIWDRYPGVVIEATEFSERVGAFNQRLVVWEARDY